MLAPSQKISTIIINGTDRENRKEKGVEFPDEMSVKVSYEIKRLYSDGRIQRLPHSFTYQFSFASQNKTFQHRGEIADEINLIYEFIKKNFKKE